VEPNVSVEITTEKNVEKSVPKKRASKAAKKSDILENGGTAEELDVIIPSSELSLIHQFQLPHNLELSEDLVLTEVFVNDVLFFKDEANLQFYNQLLIPIQNPTL
jgi:hypothetical protein